MKIITKRIFTGLTNLIFVTSFITGQLACSGNNDDPPESNKFLEDSSSTSNERVVYSCSSTHQRMLGTIDDQYEIYIEYNKKWPDDGMYEIDGFYCYTSNNSIFDLEGEEDDQKALLKHWRGGEINEQFQIDLSNKNEITGWWQKENNDQLDVSLKMFNNDSTSGRHLLDGVLSIYELAENLHLLMDYSWIEDLFVDEYGCLTIADEFDGLITNDKINFRSHSESTAGGHTDEVYYVLVQQDDKADYVAQIECQNGWQNDYHDMEIDEDDEYGLDPWYLVTTSLFEIKDGSALKLQEVSWEGNGEATIYFYLNRVVMLAGEGKEVLYYSFAEKAFTEH